MLIYGFRSISVCGWNLFWLRIHPHDTIKSTKPEYKMRLRTVKNSAPNDCWLAPTCCLHFNYLYFRFILYGMRQLIIIFDCLGLSMTQKESTNERPITFEYCMIYFTLCDCVLNSFINFSVLEYRHYCQLDIRLWLTKNFQRSKRQ